MCHTSSYRAALQAALFLSHGCYRCRDVRTARQAFPCRNPRTYIYYCTAYRQTETPAVADMPCAKKAAAHGKSRCGSFLCHITLFAEFYVCSSMFKACSDKYFYIALVAFLSHSSSSPSKSGLIAANTFAWYAFNLSFSSAVMQDTSTASRSNGTIVSGSKPMN